MFGIVLLPPLSNGRGKFKYSFIMICGINQMQSYNEKQKYTLEREKKNIIQTDKNIKHK